MAEVEKKRLLDWLMVTVIVVLTAAALLLIFTDMQGIT
jgi:hypothetical protein